ncbi:hypothetical protein [Mesobacillus harenae]|uniref:hypothetical protein n=1 Tax=Mesobacillus harenae TaxID=2213203 RepID=UPI001580D99F|nr:hypothetical protein [Mesobacillus harenae]
MNHFTVGAGRFSYQLPLVSGRAQTGGADKEAFFAIAGGGVAAKYLLEFLTVKNGAL